jgi:hypothetical protein
MGRGIKKPEDFQKFYYDKVATGEGCGCAERIIDTHEFNRLAGTSRRVTGWLPRRGALGRFLRKAGLYSRP